MSLQRKLRKSIILLLIPFMFLLYVVVMTQLKKNVYESTVSSLHTLSIEAQTYTMNYIARDQQNTAVILRKSASLLAPYLAKRMNTRIQIFSKEGDLLADSERSILMYRKEDINKALKGTKAYTFEKTSESPLLLFSSPVYTNSQTIGVIRFIYPLKRENRLLTHMNFVFLLTCLLISVIAIYVVERFSHSVSRPLTDLSKMVKKLSEGNYETKIDLTNYEELKKLSSSFNLMAKAIKLNISELESEKIKQKDFLDRVTHELKTPLTAIMGYASLIPKLKKKTDIEQSFHYVLLEGERMLRLIEELLQQSKFGQDQFTVSPTISNLRELIAETLYVMKSAIDKHQIAIDSCISTVYIMMDTDKTKQIFLNIFDNIIKYSDATSIRLYTKQTETYIHVFIEDNGIGIDEALVNEWHAASPTQNAFSSSFGNGFGLFICRELMKQQGGQMNINSSENGMVVKLSFLRPAHVKELKKN
ncbi:HAMP domain-containing sensor histidine kinase, partial [Priestia aryabhattai]|uniref:HAMP domain-containing sensor histidine kinase n=1 Tax=Priestia aryabhattai TaxID=412384 RepID=UPI001CCB5975